MDDQVRVKIIVAAHKKSEMPKDGMYLPLHVGAEGKTDEDGSPLDLGYVKDNTGENISALNPYYSELTGLYWAWKNLKAEYIGLVHYRRMFSAHPDPDHIAASALTYAELEPELLRYSVFVPKKRRYYIETLKSHYEHTHDARHLDICRDVIALRSPGYLSSYDRVLKQRGGYMFNMMILRADLLDDYCSWLFDILKDLFEAAYRSEMSDFDRRFPGRVSEILFNVWLCEKLSEGRMDRAQIKELPYSEDVAWAGKIAGFLEAKALGKSYSKSSSARREA